LRDDDGGGKDYRDPEHKPQDPHISLMLRDSTYGKLRGLKRLPKSVGRPLAHHL
jgi:hypothetical protein